MYRILIVEDEQTIAEVIASTLKKWDYDVVIAEAFDNILGLFQEIKPQLVIMDIGLPVYNGFYWCKKIRAISQVPVIFLSSRSDRMDIIMAVQMGGDDYLDKSTDLDVIVAKVQALLRRSYELSNQDSFLQCGELSLYPEAAQVCYGEKKLVLTTTQMGILTMLFRYKGTFVSREQLATRLWEDGAFIDDNTLSVNVNRLRKKLAEIGVSDFIITKKGYGYGVGMRDEG